jgi:putative peptidoglycan lipid II flippase
LASEKNEKDFKELLSFSLRIANFVLIPSFIGLALLGFPIVQVLFQHGQFTIEQSRLTYWALLPYAAGLPAYSATKILATAFYSHRDTKTPVRVALWSMVVNAILNLALMWKLEVAGLALATTISAWFQVVCLFLLLRKKLGLLGGKEIVQSFLYGLGAGAAMGTVCYGLCYVLLAEAHLIIRVFVSISVGAVFYFGLSKILKIKECEFFFDFLARRKIPN